MRDPNTRRPLARWPASLLFVGLIAAVVEGKDPAGAVPRPAGAQAREMDAKEEPAEEGGGAGAFATADREKQQSLQRAQQLLARQQYADAVALLDKILQAQEDVFLTNKRSQSNPGLKAEAQRLLGQMPRQGRELYELQYGKQARQMLEAAATAGDPRALAEVSRRFFHTRAGYEATLLLGLHQLDHASPLAGALTLKRLHDIPSVAAQFEPGLSVAMAACWLRAGMPDKAKEVLEAISRASSQAKVTVAGVEMSVPAASQTLAAAALSGAEPRHTEQWAMFRGNPARNASTSGSGPLLSTHWRVPVAEHPLVETTLEQIYQSNRDQDHWAIPALHPLVVQDVVLMRTARSLLAVDFLTGKRLWEVPGDDPFESLLDPPQESPFVQPQPLELSVGLRFRLWGDATFGTLSSDGQLVFAVEDLPLDVGLVSNQAMFMGTRRETPHDPKSFNRLAAYDVRSGKLVWHVGGSPEEQGLPLAGAFFLGPPMPLTGQLCVIAELKGEIKLLVLEARSGRLLWPQQLRMTDQEDDILQSPLRRIAGVTPSYADGVLICPTSYKSLVALDWATRSLLWGYRYEEENASATRQAPVFFGTRQSNVDLDPASRWTDSSVTIAEGAVLVTPVDSNQLHCLNLVDGKVRWRKPREDNLYLACVYQGKAVLVGRRSVQALKLTDGSPAWEGRKVEFAGGAMPSGTGFLSGQFYYVPLSCGEVLAIDVATGQAGHTSKSRRGAIPGNLVCYRGRIVSQRPAAVEQFYQLDALRRTVDDRLAANPDDPEALAQRGEILWEKGQLGEAVTALRRASQLAPGPAHRSVLREALLEGLKSDFATYRQTQQEILGLLEEPRHEAAYLRLMTVGLQAAGEYREALTHVLKLVGLDEKQREMDVLERGHSVRRDRWIQLQLAELRQAAPADLQAEIDKVAQARLDDAVRAGDAESLQRFLDYFGSLPLADPAQRTLAQKLRQSKKYLQAELVLRRLERSADRTTVAAAVAELADMLRQVRLADDAAACYRRLASEFADVVCRDGKTGRELVEALPAADPIRQALQPAGAWPVGAVTVAKERRTNPAPVSYTLALMPFIGPRGPFFEGLALELQSPQTLVARDGWGKPRWQMQTSEVARLDRYAMSLGQLRAGACGHLLLMSLGSRVVAIDAMVPEGGTPRVVWQQDFEPAKAPPAASRRVRAQFVGGMQRFTTGDAGLVNVPAPISEQLVCLQRFHTLQGVSPATGEVLWTREDVRPGSTVFGDSQYVLVVPPEQTTASLLRAADGKLLGTRAVPPASERLTTCGRFIVAWRAAGDPAEATLEMLDPWKRRPVWAARRFDARAKTCVVDNDVVGVFQPNGRFVLVSLADGRSLVDTYLMPERTVSDLYLFRSPEQYLLVLNGLERNNGHAEIYYGVHGVLASQITRAKVYGFDRQGKPLWPRPTVVEDQFLLTSQPDRLPALLFVCGIQEKKLTGSVQQKLSVVGIDKRTGRAIRPKELPEGSATLRVVGDPAKKTVEVQLQREVVTMNFTDQPLAAEEDAAAKPAKPAGAIGRALQKGLEEGLRRFTPQPANQ